MTTTRRNFVGGCSAAIAAMAGSRLGQLTFADPATTNGNVLVNIFLRGGWDALNVIIPAGGPDYTVYYDERPNLRYDPSGGSGGMALTGGGGRTIAPGVFNSGNGQGLSVHRRLMQTQNTASQGNLWDLWTDRKLAFVVAAGLSEEVVTRSHFDAQELIELGTNSLSSTSGWLARHLQSATNLPPEAFITGAAIGNQEPTALLGAPGTANFGDISNFNLQDGYWRWRPAFRTALRNLLESGSTPNHLSGVESLDAVDIIETATEGSYTPANGAVYNGSLGSSLRSIAQLVKLDLGLQVATVDYGGWDTHNGQGDGLGGGFGSNLDALGDALFNFFLDLNSSGSAPYSNNVTVVIQSEFGRRLSENFDRGTDHGYGALMMVLGGEVNGGVYGSWPGFVGEQLFDNKDLRVTTDYRRVMSEILVKRMCNQDIETVFPGYSQQYLSDGGSMGIVNGFDPVIFGDGFESGNTTGWSSTTS